MKKTIFIALCVALAAVSCVKPEQLRVTPTSGVNESTLSGYEAKLEPYLTGTGTVNAKGDDEYYANLREWKENAWDERGLAKRSISYIFFADYGSMAFRFADIPDSVDVINLWGGCPKLGSLDYMEMQACREVKGMKVVGCRITRILENAKWGMQAEIPSYMEAYENYIDEHQDDIAEGRMTEQEVENNAKNAANAALRADIAAHGHKNADGTFPDWVVYGADLLLNEIWEYDIDGYDLDYEPEGDPLSGSNFNMFVEYMAQYIGPKSENPETLLIIDRNSGVGDSSLAKYCNFWIYQKYGSTGGASPASQSDFPSNLNPDNGWVPCQVITTENVGDTYSNACNNLEQMARFQPSTCGRQYGHKGGFASFHGQRDWRLEAEGAEKGKKLRYQHHRKGIEAQAAVKYYGE